MNGPENPQIAALMQQAEQHRQAGQPVMAANAFMRAGVMLTQQSRLPAAEQAFRRALEIDPNRGMAYGYLSLAALDRNAIPEAEDHARRALELQPQCAEALQALGLIAMRRHDTTEAIARLTDALAIKPDLMPARNNLASAYAKLGRHEEALEECNRALILQPLNRTAHFNRATMLLALERYEEGWLEYEWRFLTGQVSRPEIPRPRWDGSPLNGRSILVHTEQGMGDVFQFIRFLPLLKESGGRIVLACQSRLQPILSRCTFVDEWFPIDQPAGINFDIYTPLLSLPGLLKINQTNIPAEIPYVYPDPERVERWRPILQAIEGLKIGICWQGSPTFIGDWARSIPLEQFAPLAEAPGVQLISLQRIDGIDQIERVSDRFSVRTLDGLDESCGAFEDTAAVMQHLDLVVTCDSSCVHLAGALGVPAWVALSTGGDWRWLRNRTDTPWYPKTRLFRQRTLGDWKGVFEEMRDRLRDSGQCS